MTVSAIPHKSKYREQQRLLSRPRNIASDFDAAYKILGRHSSPNHGSGSVLTTTTFANVQLAIFPDTAKAHFDGIVCRRFNFRRLISRCAHHQVAGVQPITMPVIAQTAKPCFIAEH